MEKVYETPGYFFLKLKAGGALIIPKLKVRDVRLVANELSMIAKSKSIEFVEMPNWRWK